MDCRATGASRWLQPSQGNGLLGHQSLHLLYRVEATNLDILCLQINVHIQVIAQQLLQSLFIDLAISAGNLLNLFFGQLGSATGQIDSAIREVHRKRDNAGNKVKEEANSVERNDGRIKLPTALTFTLRMDDGATSGSL